MKKLLCLLFLITPFIFWGQNTLTHTPGDYQVNGGIKVGNTNWASPGVLRYTEGVWYGFNGTSWLDLTNRIPTSHPANGITNSNITNWLAAYSWGDHATEGYLKTEVDGSITNELQNLSTSNDTIFLTSGGFVKLPTTLNILNSYLEVDTLITITPGTTSGSDSTYYTFPAFTGNTIYIDPNSPTNGVGTIGDPRNTFTGLTITANNKYLIKRGTTISGALPGFSVGPVMYGAYGDSTLPRPIILGNLSVNQGYGLIKDLEFQVAGYGNGLRFTCSQGNVWVYNCKITGAGQGVVGNNCGTYWDEWGISDTLRILYTEIYDTWTDGIYVTSVQNVEIAHCNIRHVSASTASGQPDEGDNIQVQGPHVNINIHHNYLERSFTRPGKFSIIVTCPEVNSYPGSYIAGDILFNTINTQNTERTGGIYLYGSNAQPINIAYNNFRNITGGSGIKNYTLANIYYNLFEDGSTMVATGDQTAQPPGTSYIYNNLFHNYSNAAIAMDITGVTVASRNNLFIQTSGDGVAFLSNIGSLTANYDHFYNTRIISTYTTLAQIQANGYAEYEVNGSEGDPLLNNTLLRNYRPTLGSPLLNSGVNLSLTKDFSNDNVTNPPSKSIYENIEAPLSGSTEPSVVVDTVVFLSKASYVIGDYSSGNYAKFSTDGVLSFYGDSDLALDYKNLPIAKGEDYSIQFALSGLLTSDSTFNYYPDSSTLVVDTIRVSKIKFEDGTEMSSYEGLSFGGLSAVTKLYITNGNPLTSTPDLLYVNTGEAESSATITINYPGYYLGDVLGRDHTGINDTVALLAGSYHISDFYFGASPSTVKIAPSTKTQIPLDGPYYFTNVSAGFQAVVELKKNPLYVAPIPLPPYLDGNTSGWYAFDTATYYDINGTALLRAYDKTGRKELGAELLSPVNFQSGWSASNATATGALTFTTTAAGGMNRNLSLNTRGIYSLLANGSTSAGTCVMYNTNNNMSTQIIGNLSATPMTFTGTNIYLFFRNTVAGDITITEASLKRYKGNHLVQHTIANQPTYADGVLSFNGSSQRLLSAITPTMAVQKVFIVGQKGTGGYYLYTSLDGFGEITSGVLTLGANSALSTHYDVDIKEIVLRNEDNSTNEALFKNYLKNKYNVQEAFE